MTTSEVGQFSVGHIPGIYRKTSKGLHILIRTQLSGEQEARVVEAVKAVLQQTSDSPPAASFEGDSDPYDPSPTEKAADKVFSTLLGSETACAVGIETSSS
jgi:hypothetical protein